MMLKRLEFWPTQQQRKSKMLWRGQIQWKGVEKSGTALVWSWQMYSKLKNERVLKKKLQRDPKLDLFQVSDL